MSIDQELVDSQEGTKVCIECKTEKSLTAFYVHPLTSDGRQGVCKECQCERTKANRASKREYYSKYERNRRQDPARKERQLAYAKAYRARYPEKVKCRQKFRYALKAGKMKNPYVCEECEATETQIQGHHDDYNKPYQVRWLCFTCHRKAHGQIVVTKNSDYA